jgi:hypothetical protein
MQGEREAQPRDPATGDEDPVRHGLARRQPDRPVEPQD